MVANNIEYVITMRELTKRIIKWMMTTAFLAYPRKIILEPIIAQCVLARKAMIIFYSDPKRTQALELIRKIKSENKMVLGDNEAYQILMAVERTEKIDGDIAEVGVFRGSSAKLICEAKSHKILHLFDTFEGLPDSHEEDNPKQFKKGGFSAPLEDVKNYLKKYHNVYFYKGFFPFTAEPVKNKKFSFVNLDVDLCQSTKDCLEFFYPRMNRGGVIISHDYISVPGVQKAIDDFFKNKPEPVIELSGSQCLIVKL